MTFPVTARSALALLAVTATGATGTARDGQAAATLVKERFAARGMTF